MAADEEFDDKNDSTRQRDVLLHFIADRGLTSELMKYNQPGGGYPPGFFVEAVMGVLKQPQVRLNPPAISDDEMAFIRAIKDAEPEEDTGRLVYADWLDENGPPQRAGMGETIRDNLFFRRAAHEQYRDQNFIKRMNAYSERMRQYMAVWFGHEAASWEAGDNRRKMLFLGGMLQIRGEPRDLNKFPDSAAPWVQRLNVRGPNGGAGGIISALNRTRAVELSFASEYTGTRTILERFTRSIRRSHHHAFALRYLDVGVWPTEDTLNNMLHWHHDLIKQMRRVRVLAGSRRNDHAFVLFKEAAERTQRYWAKTSGRDIIELPKE